MAADGQRITAGDVIQAQLGLPSVGPQFAVSGITLDSRAVQPGDLYAALPGFTTHGARFAGQALELRAAAILTDPAGLGILQGAGLDRQVPVLVVSSPRGVLGELSALVHGHPARRMATTGITGTNGKTTTCYLLDAALRGAGMPTGVIGTVATQILDEVLPAARTTPEAPALQALLARMDDAGVAAVTMEVSSHALGLGRVDGLQFDVVAFTNLSRDHLDFHGDMESYFATKASLFTAQRARMGVICVDDEWGRRLADEAAIPVQTLRVISTDDPAGGGTGRSAAPGRPGADWTVESIRSAPLGRSEFLLRGPDDLVVDAGVGLPGGFNVANAALAIATAVHLGVAAEQAAIAVSRCPGVPGRMERIDIGQDFLAVVDYAHTPDAVARALAAIRATVTGGRVIAVLGCGGDRDAAKRPLMGRELARGADVGIVTDDNPRSESPAAIRAAIMSGAGDARSEGGAQVHEEADRGAAIGQAVSLARAGDAVVVLGKGHEKGQEVAGVIHPFDDRVALREALRVVLGHPPDGEAVRGGPR